MGLQGNNFGFKRHIWLIKEAPAHLKHGHVGRKGVVVVEAAAEALLLLAEDEDPLPREPGLARLEPVELFESSLILFHPYSEKKYLSALSSNSWICFWGC